MNDMKKMRLNFTADFSELVHLNRSFAMGRCAIAYAGRNQNRTSITKEEFEKALPSLKNCPLVANYNLKENTLGGHDVEFITDNNGVLHMVDATIPFGVVPESARQYWENIDGIDYLVTEVLLWKRCPVTKYIMTNKKVAQSMEINVPHGCAMDRDGYWVLEDFEFEALCAIGVDPCFEEANISFSADQEMSNYSKLFQQMIYEFENFELENQEEGGSSEVTEVWENELNVEEPVTETIEVVETTEVEEAVIETEAEVEVEAAAETEVVEAEEVVEVEESEPNKELEGYVLQEVYDSLLREFTEYKERYKTEEDEVNSLRDFKAQAEKDKFESAAKEIFAQFEDLEELEDFTTLKENHSDFDLETISEKCYALRGKFSVKPQSKSHILPIVDYVAVDKSTASPYGTIFD